MSDHDEELPVCPGCGAVAEQFPANELIAEDHLETVHELDCPWMADIRSERYDV